MRWSIVCCVLTGLIVSEPARAQLLPDLPLPTAVSELPSSVPTRMALYKPSGPGPFPALVVFPGAGGLLSDYVEWAAAAVRQGYVVLALDFMKPRNLNPPDIAGGKVRHMQGAKDSLQALAHLQHLPIVDPERIGIVGFSWGGMAALLAGSPEIRASFSAAHRYAAIVAFYPGCYYPANRYGAERLSLHPDHDTPTLILNGAKDNEGTPEDCAQRADKLRSEGKPVESFTYPDAGHAWDAKAQDGFTKTDPYGHRINYRYDKAAAADSRRRALEFLASRLHPST